MELPRITSLWIRKGPSARQELTVLLWHRLDTSLNRLKSLHSFSPNLPPKTATHFGVIFLSTAIHHLIGCHLKYSSLGNFITGQVPESMHYDGYHITRLFDLTGLQFFEDQSIVMEQESIDLKLQSCLSQGHRLSITKLLWHIIREQLRRYNWLFNNTEVRGTDTCFPKT